MTRFTVFQPDFPHQPVLVGDVTGEFVHASVSSFPQDRGNGKRNRTAVMHVYTSGHEAGVAALGRARRLIQMDRVMMGR